MNDGIFLKKFGLTFDEVNGMKGRATDEAFSDKGKLSRLNTISRDSSARETISTGLAGCKRILSKVGLLAHIYLVNEMVSEKRTSSQNWDELLGRVLLDPLSFRDPTVWLLFQAALQSERDFSLDVCPVHSREDVLTGRFIEGLSGACRLWADSFRSYLNRTGNVLEISSIDLTVGGGEQATGGDFALILDIRKSTPIPPLAPDLITLTGPLQGPLFVPLLFQAKCYTGESADISQKHKTRGYQFSQLRKTVCASNYIFYENGTAGIQFPALPMVKPSSACSPVESAPKTPVFEKSVNFSTYLLKAINGFDDIPSATTREEALNMILANTSENSITRVAILGNTHGLDVIYRDALAQLRSQIDSENMLEPNSEEPPSNDGSRIGFRKKR